MTPGWHGQAYGLALEGDGERLGLPEAVAVTATRRTVLRSIEASDLDAAWPAGAARLATEHAEPDRPPRTIDEHPEAGWRLDAPGWGLARVARDGGVVDCARGGAEDWRWQRFFAGRVLPFAAVAAGLEALHASAVVIGEAALALSGPTSAGKSSVAAALALRGHPVLTDDVLALEVVDGVVRAHPGPPVLALRDAEAAVLGPEALRRVGAAAGAGGGKSYLATPAVPAPCRLGGVALLHRTGAPGGVDIRELPSPGPRALLGALFVPELRTPQRVRGHLELLALVAERVGFVEVHAGLDATAGDVAGALLA